MNKTSLLLILIVMYFSTQALADMKACLLANNQIAPNAIEICAEALLTPNMSADDKSIIYVTQASYLITKNEFNAANDSLELAFNINPKMLENGVFRYNWLRTKGILYFTKEEYVSALPFFEEAVKVAEIVDNNKTKAYSYNDLGATYLELDNYTQALKWLQKSLAIHQSENNISLSAAALANIAEIYLISKENNKAFEYFIASIDLLKKAALENAEKKEGYERSLAKIYVSVANLHLLENQYIETFHYLQEALIIYRKYKLKGEQVKVLSTIGKMYLEQSKIDNAMEFLLQAQAIEETLENQGNLDFKQVMVNAFIFNRQWDNAEKLAMNGSLQAKNNENQSAEAGFLASLATIYENKGELQQSITYLKKLQVLKKDILASKYDKSRGKLLAEIETSEKQRKLEKLEKQKTIRELDIKKQQLIFLITALLLLGLISYLLFRLKRKNKINENIRSDQSSHNNELKILSIKKDQIKLLFKGIECRIICFDLAGLIHFNTDNTDLKNKKMQEAYTEIWELTVAELDAEEQLNKDSFFDKNTINNTDTIWIHQIKYLDNLLVCLLMEADKDNTNHFIQAENIRKYSEFKQQLSNLTSYAQDLPIKNIVKLNQVLIATKALGLNKRRSAQTTVSSVDFKTQLVDLMVCCIDIWQQTTSTTPIDMAEQSGLWLVSIEDGQLRTRTMNRYTHINKIPDNPRWLQVVKTAHYILSTCDLNIHQRQLLNSKIDVIKDLMRNRALGQ